MQAEIPEDIEGKSLLPLLDGSQNNIRDLGLYSRHGDSVNVTDGRYTLFLVDPEKHEGNSRLYDLKNDPLQQENIMGPEKQLAEEFREFAVDYLKEKDAEDFILKIAEKAEIE